MLKNNLRSGIILGLFAFLAGLAAACSKAPAVDEPAHGESVLDRVVRTEPALATSIPETSRWCDRLPGLDKRRVDAGDARLYVEVEGRGTPIVLINGGPGGTHHYFHPWFSRLKRSARVVYYDQRGCGLSDFAPGEKGYSVEQAVEDLEAVRRALGCERWVVLGYSYGGFLAQLYTVLHPERVAGLVLLGASTGLHVDDGPSREGDFISEAEESRMAALRRELDAYAQANALPREQRVALSIYNNFLNGDWKRQHFYRPSPDRLAQMARYEWVNDQSFNSLMGQSESRWDFAGAFAGNPIPTLILEGRWDLTWGEKKKDSLKGNHPNSRLAVFDKAAHGIYDEDPEAFFRTLKDFLAGLAPIDEASLAGYKSFLAGWVAGMKARPGFAIAGLDWGLASSRELAGRYLPEWLDSLSDFQNFLRTGFALYDVGRYAEALAVFERLEAKLGGEPPLKGLGLIWQGHMLDLLGRRPEALGRYRKAADLGLAMTWSHSQYRLKYEISPYAGERLKTPFQRIENGSDD
ncbi:MAG TPA: alpha/beta fold hydrolase [Candidatus Aminicenantes bacterium]|nr:alpha/beta fold hydrolase [Candidatus Aminicenantes bacterium]HRY65678.1 alpha/beta fold hydrolase [Candidatus Aminicenantes bacterium]HRZ72434.1 alpha/beta fold hydrolase [Candidatus Aminicenantes bacterium]